MKFSFSVRGTKIEESEKVRAEKACKILAEKYNTEFLDSNVVIKKENHLFYADISIKNRSGDAYQAKNSDSASFKSFLGALQKIDGQIRKKKKTHRVSERDIPEFNGPDNADAPKDNSQPMIIAEVIDDLPLMSVHEATKKLNETRNVFIFENILNNAVNVVYKREDGNFGWIDYKTNK